MIDAIRSKTIYEGCNRVIFFQRIDAIRMEFGCNRNGVLGATGAEFCATGADFCKLNNRYTIHTTSYNPN